MLSHVIYLAVTQLVINIIRNLVYRVMDLIFPNKKKQYNNNYYNQHEAA